MPEDPKFVTVPFMRGDGVVIESKGWNSDGFVTLECSCGALFNWSNTRENRWLPDRRHLNFCPGCGKSITGCEIPVGRK